MTRAPGVASGLIVVDKPQGWTSHQVVGRVRRLVGTRKVGHAGTLDPMATGVLLIGVERATRLLGHLAGHDKSYLATIRLGQATVTDDAEGDVLAAAGATGLTLTDVVAAVAPYRGDIVQVPSAVSAIKVAGVRSYARVRAGEDVQLKARPVTVSRFDVLDVRPGSADGLPVIDVDVVVDCSSGTYIRALARDLGRDLGTGGHLTALRRTRVGRFGLDEATLDAAGLAGDQAPAMLSLAAVATRAFDHVELTQAEALDVRYGRSLARPVLAAPTAVLSAGEFLALYEPAEGGSRPVAVFV